LPTKKPRFPRRGRPRGLNEKARLSRREDLIEAAIAVIALYGRAGTTVTRVAKRAEISQGLMNFHFKSIDALLLATFEYLAKEFHQTWTYRVHASDGALGGTAPWRRLEAMIEAYFDERVFTSEKLAAWFTFWVDADLRDKFRSASVKVERRYHRDIENEIAHLVRDWPSLRDLVLGGSQVDPAAQKAAEALVQKVAARITGGLSAMVDGFWLQALLYPKTFKAKNAVKTCLAFLESTTREAEKKTGTSEN
jgi:TetR/AcrR family transcriptional repressor of bet genes